MRHIWEKSVCTELRSATGSFGTCHPAGGDARSRELMMLRGVRLGLQGASREMKMAEALVEGLPGRYVGLHGRAAVAGGDPGLVK